jgi:hypothetical protein
MNEFFTFLFDEDILREKLRPEWIKLYDFNYIDKEVIGNLLKNKTKINKLLEIIKEKATGYSNEGTKNVKTDSDSDSNLNKTQLPDIIKTSSSKKTKKENKTMQRAQSQKRITIPKPFKLTENKPRILKEPNELKNNFSMKPFPIKDYNKTSLSEIEEKRKNRLELIKKDTIQKYNNCKPFVFESEKRPTNIEKIREEVTKKLENSLQFNKKYCNPPKDFSKNSGDVNYNQTAILREDYLIEKKRKEEEDNLKRILIEKTDSKDHMKWIKEMKLKDDIEKLEEIQKRKIELNLNREVATTYLQRRTRINQLKALEHKKKELINSKIREEKKKQEILEKRELVKEIDKERENIIRIKKEIEDNNKEIYKNRKNEYKILDLMKSEEKKIEKERRDNLISQIRELERIPMKRSSGFDPTETPGYGLLEEMSLVELKERLEIQKKMFLDEMIAKREENKLIMKEKNDVLLEKANRIIENRDKLRNLKEIERKMKKDALKEKEDILNEIKEKNLFEVKKKIEYKKERLRKEDETFQKKIREIKLQRQFLQQGSAVVEEKKFKMIEDGLERKINDNQNVNLIEQEKKEEVKWREVKRKFEISKSDIKNQKDKLIKFHEEFENKKKLNEIIIEEDKIFKKAVYDKERALKAFQRQDALERNKFSDQLQKSSLNSKKIYPPILKKSQSQTTINSIKNKIGNSLSQSNLGVINENIDNDEINPIINKLEKEKIKEEGGSS